MNSDELKNKLEAIRCDDCDSELSNARCALILAAFDANAAALQAKDDAISKASHLIFEKDTTIQAKDERIRELEKELERLSKMLDDIFRAPRPEHLCVQFEELDHIIRVAHDKLHVARDLQCGLCDG